MAETRTARTEAPRDSGGDRPVVIVGAGPAGLATARELDRRTVPYRLLERGTAVGHTWRSLYDSLTLHTGRHLSALPDAPFPPGTPLFPGRADLVEYLQRYHDRFDLHVETGVDVTAAAPDDGGWLLRTSAGPVPARAVVVATGILSQPVVPRFDGQERFAGAIRHAVEYRRPGNVAGRSVLVVGCGNTAGDIATELADADATVTLSARTGANVVPLTLFGMPIQYVAFVLQHLPPSARRGIARMIGRVVRVRRGPPVLPVPPYGPLDSIPMIGFHLVEAIQAGKVRVAPGISALHERGAQFDDGSSADFDEIILATGYRASLGLLEGRIRTDERGFALRNGRVRSADVDDLFFVGHNYDALGGLRNITIDARLVAELLAERHEEAA